VHEERDEMIDRIVNELKTLPAVPADATARVLARVDAARRGAGPDALATDDDDLIFFPTSTQELPAVSGAPARVLPAAAGSRVDGSRADGPRRRFVVSLPAAIGYALAATLAGFLIRGALPGTPAGSPLAQVRPAETLGATSGATSDARTPVTPVAASTRDLQEAPVPVQFVLESKRANSVSVIGDFNAWDGTAAPLARDSASGVWSGVVNVRPGRHVYAFLVDGTVWTLDPRAPRTKDSDYGTEQSVMIVGLP
jgi:hypothetical protein